MRNKIAVRLALRFGLGVQNHAFDKHDQCLRPEPDLRPPPEILFSVAQARRTAS